MNTQTIQEMKDAYLARESADEKARAESQAKSVRDADANFGDAKAAAIAQLPDALAPYVVFVRPDDWSFRSTSLRVNIEIPEHAQIFVTLERQHNAREWKIVEQRRNDRDAVWGVITYEIEHSHKEKYARGQWVGWLQKVIAKGRVFGDLDEALVFAEREYANLKILTAAVENENAVIEARATEYLERDARHIVDAPEPTNEEKFLSALKALLAEYNAEAAQ